MLRLGLGPLHPLVLVGPPGLGQAATDARHEGAGRHARGWVGVRDGADERVGVVGGQRELDRHRHGFGERVLLVRHERHSRYVRQDGDVFSRVGHERRGLWAPEGGVLDVVIDVEFILPVQNVVVAAVRVGSDL